MGSEQSSQNGPKQAQRAPPIRRGHTIAAPSRPVDPRNDRSASGNDSPGASMCSDSELPYISYTNRPIGDSPKHTAKPRNEPKKFLPRRQSTSAKPRSTRDIVVVKQAVGETSGDSDIATLQEIPTFLPIMRGTLGLPGAKDPDVLEGLDFRPWVRLTTRYQAHLAACAQPLAADQVSLTSKIKEIDSDVSKLHAQFVAKQRANARNAERLARVRETSHQLSRCHSLLNQTLQDIQELNNLLPEDKRLEPFVWKP